MREILIVIALIAVLAVNAEKPPKEVIRELEVVKEVHHHCNCPCERCQPGGEYYIE